ncbi:MAG: serine hydrolase [Bacteroidota bacterium]
MTFSRFFALGFFLLITNPLLFSQSSGNRTFSSSGLDSLSRFLEYKGSSAMMIVKDDSVVFSWGATDQKLLVHSIRKSLLNSLIGIAVSEGKIDTNSTLSDWNIDDKMALSEQEKSARIADLLASRSGVYHLAAATSTGMLRNKPSRNSHAPGSHYYYNNWDFNVLGFILEQAYSTSLYTLFDERIAQPLGMTDYQNNIDTVILNPGEEDIEISEADGFYQFETDKSVYPAYHFRLTTKDMIRYARLYLQNGNWEGKQIIPADWIRSSTTPKSVYNEQYGLSYGLLWYVLVDKGDSERHSFYHTGTGVHMMAVYPSSNMVFVHRVDTEQPYQFTGRDLIGMINLVFGALE